jgi:hypothetical protein
MVELNINAVTTQESRANPPKSTAIRGKAVFTMLESNAANSIASNAPAITMRRLGKAATG